MSGHVNLKKLVTITDNPDFGETFYVVDANFRTGIAQGWSRPDGTGPMDLWAERNPGYVFGSGASSGSGLDYGSDSGAIQAAIDAAIDFRGDKVFFLPGSYSLATALAINCPGIRLLGPPVRNLRQSRVTITDAIGSGLAVSASTTDVELGYFTAVPLTATSNIPVANGANFGYMHDIYWNTLGITGSTSTKGVVSSATTIDWLVERCTFNVDSTQGSAFDLTTATRWVVQDCDFYVNITAIAWATVVTLTTCLGFVARRNLFRGCGGATPAVFTNIFTGDTTKGALMAYLNFVDGTALATATAIETGFAATLGSEIAENYQSGDATTEGGVLVKLA